MRQITFINFLLLAVLCLTLQAFSQPLLKGGVSILAKKGELVNVILKSNVNFYFSQLGDKVVCFTKEDIVLGEELIIPKGSRLEGTITDIVLPRRFGLDGTFKITFTQLTTPANETIPIYASVSTDTSKTSEKIADIVTYDTALIAYGSVHGFIAGVQYGGIPLAVISHGVSLLAGTGIGIGAGIIGSVMRKGDLPRTLLLNKTVSLALNSDFYLLGEMPLVNQKEISDQKEEYLGFRFFPKSNPEDIKLVINKIKKQHSKTYGNYITLELLVSNNSYNPISLADIVLVNSENQEIVHPDIFLTGDQILKSIRVNNEMDISLVFLIDSNIKNYYLAVLDSLDKKEVLRVPLED